MVTRRDVMTGGTLGMVTALGGPASADRSGTGVGSAETQSPEVISAQALQGIQRELAQMRAILDESLRQNSLSTGAVVPIRRAFDQFLRANTKYPDYCEIGPNVFTELYDWHVKHRLPVEVARQEGRMAIRFMFTWMLLRPEQDPSFVGIPYDRG